MRLYLSMNFIFQLIDSKFRGWSSKDRKSAVITPISTFTMYSSLAISETCFYGIMANTRANTSEVFVHFMNMVLQCRQSLFSNKEKKFCFVLDNASIHKTPEARAFATNNNLHMLTISPYCPALNGAEIIIQALKSKVKKKHGEGR